MAAFMIDKETGLPKQVLGLKPLLELDSLSEFQRAQGISALIQHYEKIGFSKYSSDIQKIVNAGFQNFDIHIRLNQYWESIRHVFPDGAQDRLLNDLFAALCGVHEKQAISFLGQHKLYNAVIHKPINQNLIRSVLNRTHTSPQQALSVCTDNPSMQALLLQMTC